MEKLSITYTLHEIIVDNNGDYIKEYDKNLPHADEIAEVFINEWNKNADEFMLEIINEQVANNSIESCKARRYKKHGAETQIVIEIVAKKSKQFREKFRNNIYDFMESQFIDGWGEGFFNKYRTAKDGIKYYIE